MKIIHLGALLLLGAIWGASFLFIGVAVEAFGPLPLMFLRVLLAGLVLVLLVRVLALHQKEGATPDVRRHWRQYLLVGLFNSALPFTLIAFSELRLTASLAAILNSTTPLFTALVAVFWGSEQLGWRKLLGVILGMVGVVVLVGGSPLEQDVGLLVAVAASLLAAFCYGIGTVYASRKISGLPPIYASVVQLMGASVVLALPAALTVPPEIPGTGPLLALLALTLLSTSFAYLLYFFLLRSVGPTRTASVTFLVPVFGTLWGILFLQEPFNESMLLGMVIILSSVGLMMRRPAKRQPAAI